MAKTRVLCYISTRLFEGGGLSSVMLNYWREIWSNPEYDEQLVVDFVSHGKVEEPLLKEIQSHGSNFFGLPSRKLGLFRHARAFNKVLEENHYDVLHYNYDSGLDAIELSLSCRSVPRRICHVHNSNPRNPLVNTLLKPLVRQSYTYALACSHAAGVNLYGENASFAVLNNAINTRRFAFDEGKRAKMRCELGIDDDAFVVGHVGRMNPRNEKNHGFLLRTFAFAVEGRSGMRLVLVGDGDRRQEWEQLASTLGIADKVLFAGFRTDIPDMMQAFDIFCFPSQWEGLGMAAIEAQASGLPALVSNAVPKEVGLTELASYMPINDGDESMWASAILSYANGQSHCISRDAKEIQDAIRAGGFDITAEAGKLVELYK